MRSGTKSSTSRNQLTFVLPLLAFIVLAACSSPQTPEEWFSSATRHYAEGDRRSASIKLKNALQQDPDFIPARLLLAQIYLDLEDGASAEKELNRAIEANVRVEMVALPLAQALLMQRRYRDILEQVPVNLLSGLDRANTLAIQAMAATGETDLDLAKNFLDKAKSIRQTLWVDYADAQLHLAQDDWQGAKVLLLESLGKHPDFWRNWSLLGTVEQKLGNLDGAAKAFRRAIETRPVNLSDKLSLVTVLIAKNDLEVAEKQVDKLLASAGKEPGVQYAAGLLYLRQGRFEKALEMLREVNTQRPGHLQTGYLLGIANAYTGNRKRAIELIQQFVARQKNHLPSKLFLARLFIAENDLDDARTLIEEAKRLAPNNASTWYLDAMVKVAEGQYVQANEILNVLLAENPDSHVILSQLGYSLILSGDLQAGVDHLKRARSLKPDDLGLTSTLISALVRNEQPDVALAVARDLAERQSDNADAVNLLGKVLLFTGDKPGAKQAFEKALVLRDGDAYASTQLARMYASDDELIRAEKVVRHSILRFPDNPHMKLLLVELLTRQGKADEAQGLLEDVVIAFPENRPARLTLSLRYLAQGKAARAVEVLSDASVRSDPMAMVLVAEGLIADGRPKEAKDVMEQALNLGYRSPHILYQLGRAYGALGKLDEFEQNIDKALAMQPDFAKARLAKVWIDAARGKVEDAQDVLESLDLPGSDARELRLKSYIARKEGDYLKEFELSREAYEVSLDRSAFLSMLGSLERAEKMGLSSDESTATLSKFLAEQPDEMGLYYGLGKRYLLSQRYDMAEKTLRALLEKDPENLYALNNLAMLLMDEHPAEALKFAERAYHLATDQPQILDTYAQVLARNGDFEKALRFAQRAIDGDAKFIYKFNRLQVLKVAGQYSTAMADAKALLATDIADQQRSELERFIASLSEG